MFIFFIVLLIATAFVGWVAFNIHTAEQSRQTTRRRRSTQTSNNNMISFQNQNNNSAINSSPSTIISQSDQYTLTLNTEFHTSYEEVRQKSFGVLPAISLDACHGYVSPSGGFINYTIFQVVGKNPDTKRKNKRIIEAKTQEIAYEKAKEKGIVEPFEITILPAPKPTERQLEYAQDLGAPIPKGACQYDVSAIISRITDNSEQQVSERFAKLADEYGILFSRYESRNSIMKKAINLPHQQYMDLVNIPF